ncbi:MAG: 4-diphosphocytidyl-2-C-methyl-D-erythritol kinase [Verrucomicrobiota bacterium]|jgi:4-diphosphocytidyl-2-C-methyl-D-erythritol kinase
MTIEMSAMQVLAPAKINLSLKVLARRPDGFHEIETLIAPISLRDEIKIDKKAGGQGTNFRCDDAAVPQGEDNLVVRAANLFFKTTKLSPAVSIELRKKIPHAAGLGGGSSDAASTLLGLNQLFETKLSRENLGEMAAKIGSDVSYFIFESAAICRGRGEVVSPTKLAKKLSILLLKPGFGVATSFAYSHWEDSKELPGISYAPQDLDGVRFVNDLERPVFAKFVFLARLKTWLLKQPEVGVALMSGSGSTMFAVLREKEHVDLVAERAKAEIDPELWTCACETR